MSFIELTKNPRASIVACVAACLAVATLAGCKEGVKAGNVQKDFTGVEDYQILGPTTVKLNWVLNPRYTEYEVYGNFSSQALTTRIFENAIIEDLTPDQQYTFSVVGVAGSDKVGFDREVKLRTWPRFDGVSEVKKDESGKLVVSWNYPHDGVEFLVYYRDWSDPDSASTGAWTQIGVSSFEQKAQMQNLVGSTRYHFMVHAKYPDGTYERPTRVLTGTTDASFPKPALELSKMAIGSLPYLITEPVINTLYLSEFYTTQVFRGTEPVSDPLTGAGTLVFSSSANLGRGVVDNLSVKVTFDNKAGVRETYVLDKDPNDSTKPLTTYIKGATPFLDVPPLQSAGAGPAYLGKSIATGDFNCDGVKDVAIGMPDASIGNLGVQASYAGAVYIYYSAMQSGYPTPKLNLPASPPTLAKTWAEPPVPGKDPQVITFDDLPAGARFGFSLSSGGNLNGDGRTPLIPGGCEDLIVGAPGLTSGGAPYTHSSWGTAFVFFGSNGGLKAPKHLADFPENIETCDGDPLAATCAAVRLWPNTDLWPIDPTQKYYGVGQNSSNVNDLFGWSVSFIGDVNGDGYEDIAIGSPLGDFDGRKGNVTNGSNDPFVRDTGFVSIYFGSKFGLGVEYPELNGQLTQLASETEKAFRFLKVYSPYPQQNAFFGASIAGGVDVDGKYRVRKDSNSAEYAGGADFVIGAPGHAYIDPVAGTLLAVGDLSGFGNSPDTATNIQPGGDGGYTATTSNTTNEYGFPQNTGAQTGAAFLYFGRSYGASPPPANDFSPSRLSYWGCGTRGMPRNVSSHYGTDRLDHYSCLTSASNVRVLFPRNATSSGFGAGVAMLGNASRADNANAFDQPGWPYIDPNRDGYGEVIVAAYTGASALYADTGVLWQFFGNGGAATSRYERNSFVGYRDNSPACLDFLDANDLTKRANCAPTTIRPNSVPAGAHMGAYLDPLSAGIPKSSMAVGDLTGDGIVDLVVGATGDSTTGANGGAVYYFPSAAGVGVTTSRNKLYDSSNGAPDNALGSAVAVGNFDGDYNSDSPPKPYNDVVAGAMNDHKVRSAGGAAHFFMSKGGTLAAGATVSDARVYDVLASPQDYGYEWTRLVGDINGDGRDDAMTHMLRYDAAGARVYDAVAYFGSPNGLVTTTFCLQNPDKVFKSGLENLNECYPKVSHATAISLDGVQLPQLILKPNSIPQGQWAYAIDSAGDVNGDGFDDVLVWGANGYLLVYYGTRGGLQAIANPSWTPASNDPQIVTIALQPSGMSVAAGGWPGYWSYPYPAYQDQLFNHGDFNGDGTSDIVIQSSFGATTLSSGDIWNCGDPVAITDQTLRNYCGLDGATPYPILRHGYVYILYGSKSGVQTPALQGTGTDFVYGSSLIDAYNSEAPANADNNNPCNASNTDNKVCKAQFLRNPVFDKDYYKGFLNLNHQFGQRTAVLDYNKDGWDDLVVSAPLYEDLHCYEDETTPIGQANPRDYGRLYVFRGSKEGLKAADSKAYYKHITGMPTSGKTQCPILDQNTPEADPALARIQAYSGTDGALRAIMPPVVMDGVTPGRNANGYDRRFGQALSVAGDLNGDGYEDLAVGARGETVPNYPDASGVVYVFYGPLCGADNTQAFANGMDANVNRNMSDWTQAPWNGVGGASAQNNADCNRGTGGLKPLPMKVVVRDAAAYAHMGHLVLGGRKGQGDVNGDGYDDLLIGSYDWTDPITGQRAIGRGVIMFGARDGLYANEFPNTLVVKNADGQSNPYSLNITWPGEYHYFFQLNTSIGDVNGDGTADYMMVSPTHNGVSPVKGVNLGAFFLFY